MVSASEKLANVLLREKRSKMAKKAKKTTYRKAYRLGARKALNYGGIDNAGILARFGRTAGSASAEQRVERGKLPYYGRGLYTGRGGFWDTLQSGWNATAGARGMLGDAARSGTFGATGVALGNVSKMLGTGAYISNDLVNQGQGGPDGVPSFGAPSDQGVILSNSEFVSDIYGPESAAQFQNLTFDVNPGLFKTFPWLSQVAANYEEYELKQLIFTYKPTITDFVSTNGQVGSVIMATQYNVADSPFTNKQDMMHYAGSMATKVSQGMLHGVECDPNKNSGSPGKYIRSGEILVGQDQTTYDLGVLNIAVCNTPTEFNSQALGELWVSYTVCLRKPKFYVAEGSAIVQDKIYLLPPPPTTEANVNNMLTYPAQQNRIGGDVFRVTGNPYIFGYRFPATTQGTFKVRFKMFQNQAGSNSSGQFNVIVTNPDLAMFKVKDLLTTYPLSPTTAGLPAWDWFVQSNELVAGQERACTIVEADIRVETATSAGSIVDNVISINWGTLGFPNFTAIEIEVVNYNNYFDYRGDGPVMLLDETNLCCN